MAKELLALLKAKGLTLGIAESCTGGLVCAALVRCPGASAVLQAGLVTYSNEAKIKLLGVQEETIARHGAVSSQCAAEMAQGACRAAEALCGVATTGIAGPEGGSTAKPVGLVYIAACVQENTAVKELRLSGERTQIMEQAAEQALALLKACL